MINLRHIKFLAIIIFSLLLSSQSFADKKFDKDLKLNQLACLIDVTVALGIIRR